MPTEASALPAADERRQSAERTRKTWKPRIRLQDSRAARAALFVVNISTFLTLWEVFARSGVVNVIFLPPPSMIAARLAEAFASGELNQHLAFSARNYVVGVVIAALVGIPLGLAAGSSGILYRVLRPYIWASASLPRMAWLPLLIMIFGYTNTSKLTLIFMAAIFPIIINTMAGVSCVDGSLMTAGKVFGARSIQRYAYIVVPHAIPYIFSGFKQGVARSLAAVVVSEMFGGSRGIGFLMIAASKKFDSAMLFAMLIIIVVAALVVVRGVDFLEAKLAPWQKRAL